MTNSKELAEKLRKDANLPSSEPTPKQLEKQRKKEAAYWNSMITRKEAFDLVTGKAAQQDEKLRMLYVTVNTLLALIQDLGMATPEKLDALAKPFVENMYGPIPEIKEDENEQSADQAEQTSS